MGAFWGADGALNLGLARNDVTCERYMLAAHTIKKMLLVFVTTRALGDAPAAAGAPPPANARLLVDSAELTHGFYRHITEKISVAFTEVVGGNFNHLCNLFMYANDTGLVLSVHDKIKSHVMSGERVCPNCRFNPDLAMHPLTDPGAPNTAAGGCEEEQEGWSAVWDDAYTVLSRYKIKAGRGGHVRPAETAFGFNFPAIRELRMMRQLGKTLESFFLEGSDDGFTVKSAPAGFMEDFFSPVAKALKHIFSWSEYKVRPPAPTASPRRAAPRRARPAPAPPPPPPPPPQLAPLLASPPYARRLRAACRLLLARPHGRPTARPPARRSSSPPGRTSAAGTCSTTRSTPSCARLPTCAASPPRSRRC